MNADLLRQMATDPGTFRQHLVIDETGTKLGDVIEPWQRDAFEAMDRALLEAAGRAEYDPQTVRYSWDERPRGHSKTADAAASALWFLTFAAGAFTCIVAAADQDQARLIRDAIDRLVKLNAWLGQAIDVKRDHIIGRNGAKLVILSADVGSSFGQTPRLVIADEVCHWDQIQGEELWGSLFSSAGKQKTCAVLSISNAGVIGTWQFKLRDRIRDNPAWRFHRLRGPVAKWITPEVLEQQRKLLLPKQFSRLWDNVWTDAQGDALDPELIDRALQEKLSPIDQPEPGFAYVCGLDLGLSSDGTGLVVLGKGQRTRRLRLAAVKTWTPTSKTKVSIEDVEAELRLLHKTFRFSKVYVDNWQTQQLIERLKRDRIPVEGQSVNAAMYAKMARTLLSVFGDGMIRLYDHPALIRELRSISLVERPPGNIRLELPRTEGGHCDAAMALLLAMEASHEAHMVSGTRIIPRVIKPWRYDTDTSIPTGQPITNWKDAADWWLGRR